MYMRAPTAPPAAQPTASLGIDSMDGATAMPTMQATTADIATDPQPGMLLSLGGGWRASAIGPSFSE